MVDNVHMIPEPPSWWHPTSSLPGFSTNYSSCGQSLDDDGNTLRNEGSNSSDSIQRRTRGPTSTHGGSVLHIEENELKQPIGEKASPLQSRLGMLARNGTMAPLNWHEWRVVPKEYKERIWDEIKASTDAKEWMKGYLMKSIGRKWKDWKCEIKKQAYYPYRTDVERLAHKPDRVEESQWRALVYYWSTPKAQEKSERNKLIRSKKKFHHTTGRTSFACVMEREKKKNNGKNMSRIEFFKVAYSKKDGRPVNDAVAQALSDMDELVSQMSESSMQSSAAVDEVFTQVMGPERPGRVRTYGFGPSPRDVFGHKKSEEMQAMQSQLDEQLSRHKAEMEAKQLEMEAQQTQMEKQMSQMEAKFEAQQRQFEVFLVQMRAMGMPIPEPARKNTNPLQVEKVPDASSTHNINSHRSSMRRESRSPAVQNTEFRDHSRASSFGQAHRQKKAKLKHINNNAATFPPK